MSKPGSALSSFFTSTEARSLPHLFSRRPLHTEGVTWASSASVRRSGPIRSVCRSWKSLVSKATASPSKDWIWRMEHQSWISSPILKTNTVALVSRARAGPAHPDFTCWDNSVQDTLSSMGCVVAASQLIIVLAEFIGVLECWNVGYLFPTHYSMTPSFQVPHRSMIS
jgi:hypothetical protein